MSQSTPNNLFVIAITFSPTKIQDAMLRTLGVSNPTDVVSLGRQTILAPNVGKATNIAMRTIRQALDSPGLNLNPDSTEVLGEYDGLDRTPRPLTDKEKERVARNKEQRQAKTGKAKTAKPRPKKERIAKGKANAQRHAEQEAREGNPIPIETFEAVVSDDTAKAA